ncbi:LDLR chaperone boca [Halotydeus destructor]|nr:LDLR chaperone boca [Halotydeus destructor]
MYIRSCLILLLVLTVANGKKAKEQPEWAKKDVRDYTDADLERLLDQWDEDEEPLEPDELPEHLRPAPKLDINAMDFNDPESMLKMSKKGKTVMAFVTVSGNPTRQETESVTGIWQSSLMNSHISAERFVISDDRAIFMFKDGAQSWEAKDFLVAQERVKEVTIENKQYPGTHVASAKSKEEL